MAEKESANLAKNLKEEERNEIAKQVIAAYRTDKQGRGKWEERRKRFYKLWMTEREPKNTPWPGASNVCLPLLAIACNQFHARSYQAMFTPAHFLKCIPIGENDQGRAKAVEAFMNWQLLYDVEHYEEEFDKLLLGVPINGMGFKKITWDFKNQRPVTEYVSPMHLVLPYKTRWLDTARRYSHEVWKHYDELERSAEENEGRYIDFDKVKPGTGAEEYEQPLEDDAFNEPEASEQEEYPNLVIEQGLYWKGKNDKTAAPYTATVDFGSQTLMRLTTRRLKQKDVEIIYNPFVDYHFFPNIEGYYSFGFGHFLEQLNEMANTAFNQIFDSGRLSNQPFGFYGRRAGIRRKRIELHPGLMTEVADAQQIYFPNMQRVDQVLFQVLGLLEQYTQQFTSTGDYLLGRESRGTKTPTASGTLAIIEQGLVLYNTMIKRLFRGLKKEFELIAFCNQINLPEKKQYVVMEDPENIAFRQSKRKDFDARMHIMPVGDPSYASKLTRRQEAAEVYQGILSNPLYVNTGKLEIKDEQALYEATKAWLETYDRKDIRQLLPKVKKAPRSPEQENAMFMQGDYVDPIEGEDIVQHLEVHERFKKTEFYKMMDADDKKLLDKHIAATKALAYKAQKTMSDLGSGVPQPQPPEEMAPVEMAAGAPPGVPASATASPASMAINPTEAMSDIA